MTRSPLWCCTSIIRSSALVQASSSLSMGHTRTLSRGSLHQEFYFGHFFARVFQVIVRVIRGVARPYMTAVFLFDQVLACTESATSEYSTTSQCLSVLLGRPGRAKCILDGLRWGKKKESSAPITRIRPLPGDSAPVGATNTAAVGGGG